MSDVMFWAVVLIGLLLAAFVGVAQVKKRLVKDDDLSGGGFSLGDLRALHRQGKMSDEEFEKAKQVILAATKRAAERQAAKNPASPAPRTDRPPR